MYPRLITIHALIFSFSFSVKGGGSSIRGPEFQICRGGSVGDRMNPTGWSGSVIIPVRLALVIAVISHI